MCNRLSVLVCCAAISVAGCGKKAPSLKTYPVTGTVTYNGKPIGGATVAYLSKNPDAPRSTGVTDPEGRFSLNTYVGGTEVLKGAPAGDYTVTIFKTSTGAGGAAAGGGGNPMESMSPDERAAALSKMWQEQKGTDGRPKDDKPKSEIPEKYGKPATSELTATVVSGENDPREFKLTD